MPDREIVLRGAGALRRHAARVRMFLPADAGIFAADEMLQDVVGFNLMLAIDGAIDLARELGGAHGFEPRTHREVFLDLAAEGIIDRDLAERLAQAAELRQRLKHAHSGFDWLSVHAEAPHHLESLTRFVTVLMEHAEAPALHQEEKQPETGDWQQTPPGLRPTTGDEDRGAVGFRPESPA
jgi:uncharacterized protein YutE (UPF0331/DUF86 family)